MQNTAAKLVTRAKARDHVKPILRELHWLPVKERICFKIAITVFKCLNRLGTQYLSELLNSYVSNRSLRSMNENLLLIRTTNLKLGERAFSVGGPMIWNSLESHLRKSPTMAAFKKSLKTELFKRSLRNTYPLPFSREHFLFYHFPKRLRAWRIPLWICALYKTLITDYRLQMQHNPSSLRPTRESSIREANNIDTA
ncbi:reverse transcriptase-like protein [Elysia marginata]|uniref:Reverse transcriptase-like protein n=1 Tax=Elysia marginata TaxID=1093978 RepID=A0AAV4EHU3_9GAST|nr:reverse transcriptase-like protein [Elysia marginata]